MTATKRAAQATQVEVTDAQLTAAYLAWCKTNGTPESFARAILALRPERVLDVRCEGCGYMTHHREHMGCVRAAKQHTHQVPSVPDDVVRVPLQVMKDASEALGNFVSDHGWGDADMQAMDNLDAYIARHEANRAAMLAAKDAK